MHSAPERSRPPSDRLIGDRDAPLCQEVFNISKTEVEAKVEPDRDRVAPQPDVVPIAILRCANASELAALFEGLERADHSWTARSYIPVLRTFVSSGRPTLSITTRVVRSGGAVATYPTNQPPIACWS